MRICYLADGRYIHARRWLRYFSDRGHEMSLLSFAPMTQHDIDAVEQAGARYLGELCPFHLKRFWHTAAQISRLRRLLRAEKIDVLHSHFVGVNAWYGALSRFHPAVITVMGGDILGEDWKPGPDIRERWLTPFALRNADLITCWSNALTRVVRRYSGPTVPIEVVHGGVQLERFSPGPRPQYLLEKLRLPGTARVILSPRLMRPLYNLDQIAAAAESVCANVPEAYFIFAVLPVAKDEAYEAKIRDILARGVRRIGCGLWARSRMTRWPTIIAWLMLLSQFRVVTARRCRYWNRWLVAHLFSLAGFQITTHTTLKKTKL